MAYDAEKQMLREFFWLHAPDIKCRFCNEPLCAESANMTFGHRRHPKVSVKVTVHHEDEDRANNRRSNLKDAHRACHQRHVHKSQMRGRPYEEEKGEGQKEEGGVDVR
jgi:hypothetical protein